MHFVGRSPNGYARLPLCDVLHFGDAGKKNGAILSLNTKRLFGSDLNKSLHPAVKNRRGFLSP